MYATLGAGFMGMLAFFAGLLGVIGAAVLVLRGHYFLAAAVLIAAGAAAGLLIRAENRHLAALRKNFGIDPPSTK